jgi:hypothetical protein
MKMEVEMKKEVRIQTGIVTNLYYYRSLIIIALLLLSLSYYYRSLIIIALLFALNLCINEIIW